MTIKRCNSFLDFMEHYAYSKLLERSYCIDGCIKIVNPNQAMFYIDQGVQILDIYPSMNYQTGQKVLVFIVDKFESMNAYNKWQKLKGKKIEIKNLYWGTREDKLERVVNLNQVIFYLDHNARLYDCKPVSDFKTKSPILAFYFDREEIKEARKLWTRR